MKILIIAHAVPYPPYPPGAGSKVIVYNLIKELSKRHQIYLISFCHSEVELRGIKEMQKYCTVIETVQLNLKKIKKNVFGLIKQIPALSKNKPFHVVLYHNQQMREKIRRVQEQNQFDMVYVADPVMAQYIYEIKNDIFKVVAPYDSISLIWNPNLHTNLLKRTYCILLRDRIKRYEAHFYSLYDACQVVSEKDKRDIKTRCPNLPIYVVPNGVDTIYYKPPEKKNKNQQPSIIFTGMLRYLPNIDAAIFFAKEVLPIILKELPRLKFFIVGGYPPEQVLRLSSPNIIVTGYVEDIRPYIAKASVYVSPLRVGAGIKNKVLEAMAMGKAIVATSVGCQGISVEHAKDIIISDNPKEMAGIIVSLLKDEAQRKRLGDNARIKAKEYSWQRVAKFVEQVQKDKWIGGC